MSGSANPYQLLNGDYSFDLKLTQRKLRELEAEKAALTKMHGKVVDKGRLQDMMLINARGNTVRTALETVLKGILKTERITYKERSEFTKNHRKVVDCVKASGVDLRLLKEVYK